jgi:hypothetical protein
MILDNKYGRLVKSNFKENPTVRVFQQSPTPHPTKRSGAIILYCFLREQFSIKVPVQGPSPPSALALYGQGVNYSADRKKDWRPRSSHS